MSLEDIRSEINEIDEDIIQLFKKRMDCSRRVAEYKRERGMQIFNAKREQEILDRVEQEGGEYGAAARLLFASIMELSRDLQHNMLDTGEQLRNEILSAGHELPFASSKLSLACFGVPGTYTHKAANVLFPYSAPKFYPSFREVFSAIQDGEAEYGIVPVENSSAGSVTEVYDLLIQYRFYIVAEVDIPVEHCLAAVRGADIGSIRKIYSHAQALAQCSDFLRSKKFEQEGFLSTAAAAKMVSESGDTSIAAICSEQAAECYGLEILQRGFQNQPDNTTRFIAVSKKLIITENADKISLCFSLPHKTGSLYAMLRRFAAKGLNLTKLESRPKPGEPFEYMFYLDFLGNARDRASLDLICALSEELPDFSYLGSSTISDQRATS